MLDKSVPFAGFCMRREPGGPLQDAPLPDGFRFVFYQDGDEKAWARIEAAVLEFDSDFRALMFFTDKFLPFKNDLYRRCMFIENTDGEKVATATAWWSYVDGYRRPWLHWVAVYPAYQGLGLGKAVVSRVTRLHIELDNNAPIFLKTQTWSYKAINIYKANGYLPTDEKTLYSDSKDNYKKAMKILERLDRQRDASKGEY